MNKIRKGDEVVVITGKDKGKRGVVLAVGEDSVTVEGINLVKKHVKPNPMKGTTGGVEAKTMPLNISNVALVDANGKASRVGIKVEDGSAPCGRSRVPSMTAANPSAREALAHKTLPHGKLILFASLWELELGGD